MVLNQDFKEFIESLNAHNVRYLVVGGYAVAFHGHPRYTKDIDLWIERKVENYQLLLKALHDFGFGSVGLTVDDFPEPDEIIQLGYPPNRIDLIFDLKGVSFDQCYRARVETEIEGIQINFIDLQDLRRNKKATGRHQDLADLENLESA